MVVKTNKHIFLGQIVWLRFGSDQEPISVEIFRQIAAWVRLGLWRYEYVGFFWFVTANGAQIDTLQGTNISSFKGILKMMFLFPRWDMAVSTNRGFSPQIINSNRVFPYKPSILWYRKHPYGSSLEGSHQALDPT